MREKQGKSKKNVGNARKGTRGTWLGKGKGKQIKIKFGKGNKEKLVWKRQGKSKENGGKWWERVHWGLGGEKAKENQRECGKMAGRKQGKVYGEKAQQIQDKKRGNTLKVLSNDC